MADKDLKNKLRSKYASKTDGFGGRVGPSIGSSVRSEYEKEGIDAVDWQVYFGDIAPSVATCADCYEHKNELCAGGKAPVQCMKEGRAQMRLRMGR